MGTVTEPVHRPDGLRRQVEVLLRALRTSPLAGATASVLLTGSHARGEASDAADRPGKRASDLDVYVITTGRAARRRLFDFHRHLARVAGREAEPFEVDLHVLTRSSLQRLPPVIRYFDLRRDAKVLAGVDVRSELTCISAADLPKYEGLRRMLNAIFFFEKAGRTDADAHPLAYLYAEAAHAFAIPVGTYRAGVSATLAALATSPYGPLLATRIVDYAAKFRCPARANAERAWGTTLHDFVTMIDLYAEGAYAVRLGDSVEAVLHRIARENLAPYVAWWLRLTTGATIAPSGSLARLLGRAYHAAADLKWQARGEGAGVPAARAFAVDPSLKIYWSGRMLLERAAEAGPAYARDPSLAADVERFRRQFLSHFLRGPDTRTVFRFGPTAAAAEFKR